MSNFSDSSFADGTAFEESIQFTLQAGISALKQKNYDAAIGHLEAVCQSATHVPDLLKAQMGLVKAYYYTGSIDRAVSLCRPLCNSANSQVKQWATQTLFELEQRSSIRSRPTSANATSGTTSAHTTHADTTGFVPLANGSKSSVSTAKLPDKTGLNKTGDETGFVPLSTPPTAARERVSPNKHRRESVQEFQNQNLQEQDLQHPEETEILSLEVSPKTSAQPQKTIEPSVKASPAVPKQILSSTRITSADSASTHSGAPYGHSTPATDVFLNNAPLKWRQADRAQKWTNLGKTDTSPLWALQPITILLLGWILCALIQVGQTLLNGLIFFFSWIPFLRSIWFADDAVWGVAIGLIILFVASPWLLHLLLQRLYQMQPLNLSNLERHSPESVRLLKRVSNQRHQSIPTLGVLPISAPLAFSYGHLPRFARIAVSQGLLDQLSDDEIATVYAAELAHIKYWDCAVLSGLVLVTQLPYWVYWSTADWGQKQHDRVLQSIAVLVSSIGYGIYWCCRLAGVWLSRVRLYYSDRTATNLTGNPNALTRALLKITIGTAAAIQHQGYTDPLVESFDLLTPTGHRPALTLGSLYPHTPDLSLLTWDRSNRFRRWFALGSSHPFLGDRLYGLSSYAQRWCLEPELDFLEKTGEGRRRRAEGSTSSLTSSQSENKLRSLTSRSFLLQTAPLVGILVGVAIGFSFWLLGWIMTKMHSYSFDWLWYEREAIAQGCVLLGFGVGLLVQINPAFRDITRSNLQVDPALAELLSDPTAMPINGTPVRFQGKLLGRRSFHNRFYQDLLLQTATGLIRLHYTSRGGFLGNLFSQALRPTDLMKPNEIVTVIGWFRRGATPWIDVDTIQAKKGTTVRSGYPIWLTLVAIISALWGIYTIFKG